MITGIIVALPDEIHSLTATKMARGDCIFINKQTMLYCSGAGKKNATAASLHLIKQGADRLISWGCAAALQDDLVPGDLILARTLYSEQQQLDINSPWLNFIISSLSALNPITGMLADSGSIIDKSSDKHKLHQSSGAIALDMESCAVANVALENNIPVAVIRCIADPVSMDLPQSVSYAMNDQGDVVLSKLLKFLLRRPYELPGLIKLGLHFNAAKNKLKLVANHLDIITGFEQNMVSQ